MKAKPFNKNSQAKSIMMRIIANGGLYGRCALFNMHDQYATEQFIIECSEQCHNRMAVEMWGERLVTEIKTWSL